MNEEGSAVGWGILSFLIPLVGLILFLCWKNEKPHTAKVCGICALVGFCLNFVVTMVSILVMGSALAGQLALVLVNTAMIY